MLRGEHLIVATRSERWVRLRMFWYDGIAEICKFLAKVSMSYIFCRQFYGRSYVEKRAERLAYLHVEIEQELIMAVEEGMEVVGIILKERRLAISTLQRIPMQLSPTPMVADAQVAYRTAVEVDVGRTLHGNSESLRPVCRSYDATVAIGLLAIVLMRLNKYNVSHVEFLIPLHWPEICS